MKIVGIETTYSLVYENKRLDSLISLTKPPDKRSQDYTLEFLKSPVQMKYCVLISSLYLDLGFYLFFLLNGMC